MAKSDFSVTALLGEQSKDTAPAGKTLRVSMIARGDIIKNPANGIYLMTDLDRLAEDIRANGIRQPLEVIPAEDGKYMLIGGERRMTAVDKLTAEGVEGFERLPCVVRESKGAVADLIDLITANATARDLTDGERMDQAVAMRDAIVRQKNAGQFTGSVRDELVRRLGESGGNVGRLLAIHSNATPEVQQMLREGKIGIMRAYQASQLKPSKQMGYAETGRAPSTPPLSTAMEKAVVEWIVTDSCASLNFEAVKSWAGVISSKALEHAGVLPKSGSDAVHILSGYCDLPGGKIAVIGGRSWGVEVHVYAADDKTQDDELYTGRIYNYAIGSAVLEKYKTEADKEAEQRRYAENKARQAEIAAEGKAARIVHEKARVFMADVRNWPEKVEFSPAGITMYTAYLEDGSHVDALMWNDTEQSSRIWPLYRRVLADGTVINGKDCECWVRSLWYSTMEEIGKLL